MNFVAASRVLPTGVMPCSASPLRNSCEATIERISALSLSAIASGTLAPTAIVVHDVATKPGTPASAAVGTCGNAGNRVLPVTASARSLPVRI